MKITTSALTRVAAVAAVIAGAIYMLVQFIHPADVVASLTTPMWQIVHVLSFFEAVLVMIGLAGIYLRQVPRFRILGFIAFAMFGLFFVLQAAFNFFEAFIAPLVAVSAPQLAVDIVGLFGRTAAVSDLGILATLPLVGAVLYAGGALLFGIAIVRARVLSRGAGILMIVAAVVTPVAGALLPHALERMAALPMGAALVWLGVSLWTSMRAKLADTQPTAHETDRNLASAV